MTLRIAKASRRGDGGFTLIELLVLIIILGILAAVTVFAVTGVGDKGQSNAVAADEATLRTAQESFCATEGRYGSEAELIDANLLSGPSSYNALIKDVSSGPCGNTGFVIGPTDLGGVACEPGQWCTAPPPNGTTTTSGNRRVGGITSPPGDPMVQLPSGRILVQKGPTNATTGAGSSPILPFQVFDPAAGPMGTWTVLSPPNTVGSTTPAGRVPNLVTGSSMGLQSMTVLRGTTASCGPHCGKVLVKIRVIGPTVPVWWLFDENESEPCVPGPSCPAGTDTDSVGRWTALSTVPPSGLGGGPYRRWNYSAAIQLTISCGTNCGKVLIVGQGAEDHTFNPGSGTPAIPEIWDPTADQSVPAVAFRKLGLSTGYREHLMDAAGECPMGATPTCRLVGDDRAPTLVGLRDGRVLVISGSLAQVFDPVAETFRDVAPPPANHSWRNDTAVLLPGGSVLATSNGVTIAGPQKALMYHPEPDPGNGSWDELPMSCGDGASFKFCHLLTSLADGKVLAKRTNDLARSGNSNLAGVGIIFDPADNSWTTTPAVPNPVSANWGVLIRPTSPGSCGNLCNRVLVGGNPVSPILGLASIYTPR